MNDSLKAFDKVMADFAEIKEKGNFLPDCTTTGGYEASKKYVLKVTTPARTALASAHKEAKAYYLEGGRSVDSKKNELMAMLEDVQRPHQEAYKAVDEENKRIKAEKEAAIQNGFDTLNGYAQQALGQTSSFIDELLSDCGSFDLDDSVFGKELPAIVELQAKVMGQLTDAYTQALQFEDMQRQQAELKKKQEEMEEVERKQRAEKEDQERAERDAIQREQMRQEAEEAAAAETERLKLAAEQAEVRRVEQEKQHAIDIENAKVESDRQNKLAAERAAADERRRIDAVKADEKAEAERLEADKKHSRAIKDQAYNCLVQGGMDSAQAKLAIKLIASRKVANVQINY